jgi:transposase
LPKCPAVSFHNKAPGHLLEAVRPALEPILETIGSLTRRHREKIAARRGKNAKKRAVVAVARKLSVLLHSLWISGEIYEPLRNTRRSGAQAA